MKNSIKNVTAEMMNKIENLKTIRKSNALKAVNEFQLTRTYLINCLEDMLALYVELGETTDAFEIEEIKEAIVYSNNHRKELVEILEVEFTKVESFIK